MGYNPQGSKELNTTEQLITGSSCIVQGTQLSALRWTKGPGSGVGGQREGGSRETGYVYT